MLLLTRAWRVRRCPGPLGKLTCTDFTPLHHSRVALHTTGASYRAFYYRRRRPTPENQIDPLTRPSVLDRAVLHLVSVPIGNLKDFTIRALEVLEGVDYIVTPDRTATRTLLDLVHIPSAGRLIHFSKSNTTMTTARLVEFLRGGRSLALVVTSGTPGVGDVGAGLVRAMLAEGIRVSAVPGASAVLTALTMSGWTASVHDPPTHADDGGDRLSGEAAAAASSRLLAGPAFYPPHLPQPGSFFFGHVLPSAHGARLRLLREVVGPASYPCVFYELPRRVALVLNDIAAVLPTRRVFLAHELTKQNESAHSDTAERLLQFYQRREAEVLLRKGQVVLVIAPAAPQETNAWLQHEAARRRRRRRTLQELLHQTQTHNEDGSGSDKSTPQQDNSNKKDVQAQPLPKPKQLKRLRRKKKQVAAQRRRARIIQAIEKEQERLRLNCAIGRDLARPV